jgi:hypothetical protein
MVYENEKPKLFTSPYNLYMFRVKSTSSFEFSI